MADTLWQQVERLLQQGKGATIEVSLERETTPANDKYVTRRVRDPNNPYAHWRTSTKGMARPRCAVCRNVLRKKDYVLCGKVACVDKAKEYAERLLDAVKEADKCPED